MKEQFDMLITLLVELMEREDIPVALAKFYWRTFSALTKEGFSSQEAMELLKGMTIPGANVKS